MQLRQNWKLVLACLLAGALGVTVANYGASLYFDLRFLHAARLFGETQQATQRPNVPTPAK